jgi:hypothetical protein
MFLVAVNAAHLSSKQSAFVFLLGTYGTSSFLAAFPATALQLDVFLRKIQFVNIEIFLVESKKP